MHEFILICSYCGVVTFIVSVMATAMIIVRKDSPIPITPKPTLTDEEIEATLRAARDLSNDEIHVMAQGMLLPKLPDMKPEYTGGRLDKDQDQCQLCGSRPLHARVIGNKGAIFRVCKLDYDHYKWADAIIPHPIFPGKYEFSGQKEEYADNRCNICGNQPVHARALRGSDAEVFKVCYMHMEFYKWAIIQTPHPLWPL